MEFISIQSSWGNVSLLEITVARPSVFRGNQGRFPHKYVENTLDL